VVMSMTITLPDEAAERVTAAAAARGVSADKVVVELVMDLPAQGHTDEGRDVLEAFLGSVRGTGTAFEIHSARGDLASQRAAQGIENL
jgi:hypothetical protein